MPVAAAVAGPVVAAGVGHVLSRGDRRAARRANNAATASANQQMDIAKQRFQFWKDNYRGIEEKLAADVSGTPDYASREATAVADYSQAAKLARESEARRQRSYGVDPSSGRSLERSRKNAIGEAAGRADIINRTRIDERDRFFDKQMRVANLGRGIPSESVNALASGGALSRQMGGVYQNRAAGTQALVGNILGGVDWGKAFGGGGGSGTPITGGNYALPNTQQPLGSPTLGFSHGGEVRGPGGPMDDAVPANLSDGEFVIPAHVVRAKGTEFFEKLIESASQEGGRK